MLFHTGAAFFVPNRQLLLSTKKGAMPKHSAFCSYL